MAENKPIQTEFTVTDEQEIDGVVELTVMVKVRMDKPAQTSNLITELERVSEIAGQQYKRDLCKWLIERADDDVVASKEQSEELTRHEKKPYSIKTIFGNVPVKRVRVKYRNGRTETPSAAAWSTPQSVCISKGLRAAVCGLAVKMSVENTQVEISRRTGEKDLLSTRTVLNILHEAGDALQKAVAERARRIYEEIPEAKWLSIDKSKAWRKKYRPILADESWESDYEHESLVGVVSVLRSRQSLCYNL